MLSDFPKIECPFIRKTFAVNKEDFKQHGSALQLRAPEVYLVTDEINPGFEWVLNDSDTNTCSVSFFGFWSCSFSRQGFKKNRQ